MAGLTKTLEISLVNGSLALTYFDDGVAKLPTEYYPVCGIKSIKGVAAMGHGTRDAKNQRKNSYPFTDMLQVVIDIESKENKIIFDIQSVTNQATWTANVAGLAIAIDTIRDWAAECGCCDGVEVALDGILETLNELTANTGEPVVFSSMTVLDDNFSVFERRVTYDPSTQVYTVSYHNEDGTVGSPDGPPLYTEEQMIFFMETIWNFIGNAGTPEGTSVGNFSRLAIGGLAADSEVYPVGALTPGFSGMVRIDGKTFGLIVQDNHIESELRTGNDVVSNSTTYVTGDEIDLVSYSGITLYPNVVSSGATTGYFKIQWSADATNWFDETINEPGTAGVPAVNEQLITQSTAVWSFDASATGLKTRSAVTLTKRARYIRVVQKSADATSITVNYPYQLLR